MNRLGRLMTALAVAGLVAGTATAQERKLIAPVRGEATMDITKPDTKLVAGEVVTKLTLRNTSKGAIAGLKIEENWYDKGGNPVGGDTYRHPRPLKEGEVISITLKTPRTPAMQSNQYQFTHANGSVKTKIVPKIEAPPTSGN
jgi:hypothetical protein